MYVFLRMIQYMKINLFSHILIIKRTVRIRDHISQAPAEPIPSRRKVFLITLGLSYFYVPHLQEYHGKALHRVSLQHYRRILPVSKTL